MNERDIPSAVKGVVSLASGAFAIYCGASGNFAWLAVFAFGIAAGHLLGSIGTGLKQ